MSKPPCGRGHDRRQPPAHRRVLDHLCEALSHSRPWEVYSSWQRIKSPTMIIGAGNITIAPPATVAKPFYNNVCGPGQGVSGIPRRESLHTCRAQRDHRCSITFRAAATICSPAALRSHLSSA
ncbi:poly(ethylene terephthalate) hydrolase family protein [Nocardia salmonicida]|uniref:poly(ethylene terephthalate) hydrolase family protein n=1 Tax=Nocardia salmonicida TaxID=53431 RepID=UPI00403ACD38